MFLQNSKDISNKMILFASSSNVLLNVHGCLIIHVSNVMLCNVAFYMFEVCAWKHAVLEALGTRRSFSSRRVASAGEDFLSNRLGISNSITLK